MHSNSCYRRRSLRRRCWCRSLSAQVDSRCCSRAVRSSSKAMPDRSHFPADGSKLSQARVALREAREEIGLDPNFVSIVGYLPDHVLLSGFRVTPVVGFVRSGFELQLASKEVQDTFEVPLAFGFEPANHKTRLRRFADGAAEVEVCDIPFGTHN